jgi:hypothetical protein
MDAAADSKNAMLFEERRLLLFPSPSGRGIKGEGENYRQSCDHTFLKCSNIGRYKVK